MAASCVFNSAARSVPHRQDIVAIHDFSGDSVSGCTIRHILHGHLALQWRGVSVLIVVTDIDHRTLHDRSHVDALMPVAAAGGAITERANDHAVLPAHFEREADACGYRHTVSQHADEGD